MVKVIPQTVTKLNRSNPLEVAEYAARICYKSEPKHDGGGDKRKKFLLNLADLRHLTPFEHAWMDVPIANFSDEEKDLIIDEYVLQKGIPRFEMIYDKEREVVVTNMRRLIEICGSARSIDIASRCQTPISGYYSFEIITNRAIGNQLIRHRACSFESCWELPDFAVNQESLRWVPMDDPLVCVGPSAMELLDANPNAKEIWLRSCTKSFEAYRELRNYFKKEFARSVLPLATATRILMTSTITVWYEFLKLRLDKAAEPQMQDIAKTIYKHLKDELMVKGFPLDIEPFKSYEERQAAGS